MPKGPAIKEEPQALTAAGITFPGAGHSKYARRVGTTQSWQKEAWEHYDNVGELRYGANWLANVASQAILYAGTRDVYNNVSPSVKSSPEAKALADLFGGVEGQQEMLRSCVLHMSIAGEVYIVMRDPFEGEDADSKNKDKHGTIYQTLGVEEISYQGDKWYIRADDGTDVPLTTSDIVLRVWIPHPKDHSQPDAPVKSILGSLAEVRLYDAHIKAQASSRLIGGGMLFLPNEMTLTPPKQMLEDTNASTGDVTTEDIVMWTLMSAMEASKDNLGSPASVAPVVMTLPGEHINNIQHMTFWSELDEKVIDMRKDAVMRVAQGMDLPQEIFLGTGDMNRWGAWQIEESSIKAHVEPILQKIAATLTTEYLRDGADNPDAVVGIDTSKLRLRPNRSKEAVELYDRGVLNRAALLRETGFGAEDEPDKKERAEWILMKMTQASWSPQQAEAAVKELGIDLGINTTDDEPREARPTPSLKEHPVRDRPEESVSDPDFDHEREADRREQRAEREAAAAAVTMLAARAMERAGNRLKSLSRDKPNGVAGKDMHLMIEPFPDRVDDLLKGAWDRSLVAHVEHDSVDRMIEAADAYCRTILTSREAFSAKTLQAELRKAGGR